MMYQETTVDIKFVEVQGAKSVVGYAKSFMKECGLILFAPPYSGSDKRYLVKGFIGSGYIDVIVQMSGNVAIDLNTIRSAVELNIELNSHASYDGCRVSVYEDKIATRIYYSETVNLN